MSGYTDSSEPGLFFFFFFKWPWTGCHRYNAETQRHRRWAPVDWLFLYNTQVLPSNGSMHSNTFLQQVYKNLNENLTAHIQSSLFCLLTNSYVKLIHCLKKDLCTVPYNNAVNKGKLWQHCSGNSVMISALWICHKVHVANQSGDAEGTKTIRGNDCFDKQAGFVVFFVCLVSIWQDVVLVILHRCTVSGPLWRCCMRFFFLIISKE